VPGGAATPKLAMVPACVQAGNCQYKIESVAGNGAAAYSGDDGLATAATINRAVAVAVDKNQNLFITDLNNSVIRRVDAATKTISTLSNSIHPTLALTIDQFDNIFSINNKNGILEVVKIIMNGGKLGKSAPLVTDINLHGWSFGIAVDPIGNVYVSDYAGQQIKKLTLTNGIYKTSTIAGTGATGHTGDGGPALSATFNNPSQLAVDSKGNIYVADRSNHAVRKLTLNADGSYTASTFAGIGQAGFSGDGGPANKALLSGPVGVTIDAYDNVYFSDGSNLAIRMVSASTGTISTVAGTPGKAGFDDNNGKAIGALFVNPHLISIDLFGNIYIGDCDSHRIRKLTPLS
jgi:streptogramin lyase